MRGCSWTVLLVSMVAASLNPSSEAGATGVSAGIGGGLTFPTGNFADRAQRGWQGFGALDFPVGNRLSLGIDGAYSRMKGSDDYVRALGGEPGGFDEVKLSLWRVGGRAQWHLVTTGELIPFLTAGVGAYGLSSKFSSLFSGESSSSTTNAGVCAGVGVLFKPEFSGTFALNGTYHDIFTEGSSTTYIDLSVAWYFGAGE